MRRTPAAPARASATNGGSGEDISGNEGPPAAAAAPKTAPTHSLWMLSRKFVRLLLTTQVRPFSSSNSAQMSCLRLAQPFRL